PTYAGWRMHNKKAHVRGTWPPLVDEVTHKKIVARLTDSNRPSTRGSKKVYLLSGLAKCPCGSTMKRIKTNRGSVYRCRRAVVENVPAGQGRSAGSLEFVDEVVVQSLLGALDSVNIM